MKIWKIASGISALIISVFVVYQFFFTNLLNTLADNSQTAITVGIVVVTLVVGGVVSIATRNGSLGGNIAMVILYGVSGVIALVLAEDQGYVALLICAIWILLCMVIAVVDIILNELSQRETVKGHKPVGTVPIQPGYVTLEKIIHEQDFEKRSVVVDLLPELEAKTYLKQMLEFFNRWDEETEKRIAGQVHALIAALVVVGLASAAIISFGIFKFLSNTAKATAADSSALVRTPSPSSPVSGTGTLGDYYVELRDAFITEDYLGNPALVVTYSWTNNSGKITNAANQFTERALQDGVELPLAEEDVTINGVRMTFSTVTNSQWYIGNNNMRDISPGARTEIQCAFLLANTTSSIEFEVAERQGTSNTVVHSSFDPMTLDIEGKAAE